jgi:hypothetical protein
MAKIYTRGLRNSLFMLMLNYILRNTSFDGPHSATSRAIIPKNIKANNIVNFTGSTSLIWTRDILVHIFIFLFSSK